jgi:PHD/YefM family antitoxin component YafN of YafNO toxin-antitoxin module
METKERKHDMSDKIKDKDVPVSVEDKGAIAKKEYESFIKKQEEDLDNQTYSEGEKYD